MSELCISADNSVDRGGTENVAPAVILERIQVGLIKQQCQRCARGD